jgi:hypothetical protein
LALDRLKLYADTTMAALIKQLLDTAFKDIAD